VRFYGVCRGSFFVSSIVKGGWAREGKTLVKLYSMLGGWKRSGLLKLSERTAVSMGWINTFIGESEGVGNSKLEIHSRVVFIHFFSGWILGVERSSQY